MLHTLEKSVIQQGGKNSVRAVQVIFFTFPSISRDCYVVFPLFFHERKDLRSGHLLDTYNIYFRVAKFF